MSRIPDSEKFDKNGRLHVLDDNIPTSEELKESISKMDPEYVKRIRREIKEFDNQNIFLFRHLFLFF